jgi:hypothetical protein
LSLAPIGIITIEKLQGQPFKRPLKTLYDLGSAVTIINPWALPKGVTPKKLDLTLKTAGGTCDYHYYAVLMENMTLPELSPTSKYTQPFYAYISQNTAAYDVLLGRDVLWPQQESIQTVVHKQQHGMNLWFLGNPNHTSTANT